MDAHPSGKVRIFLSYGRADAAEIAERLEADLTLLDFEVWRDRREIRANFSGPIRELDRRARQAGVLDSQVRGDERMISEFGDVARQLPQG